MLIIKNDALCSAPSSFCRVIQHSTCRVKRVGRVLEWDQWLGGKGRTHHKECYSLGGNVVPSEGAD